mmetsp:Transcript_7167/g.18002  ORF Transcript_7167/g.18002 Transcript_7167/m.18002 type:complete len:270 (-) Transcript_7167:158-967(-)
MATKPQRTPRLEQKSNPRAYALNPSYSNSQQGWNSSAPGTKPALRTSTLRGSLRPCRLQLQRARSKATKWRLQARSPDPSARPCRHTSAPNLPGERPARQGSGQRGVPQRQAPETCRPAKSLVPTPRGSPACRTLSIARCANRTGRLGPRRRDLPEVPSEPTLRAAIAMRWPATRDPALRSAEARRNATPPGRAALPQTRFPSGRVVLAQRTREPKGQPRGPSARSPCPPAATRSPARRPEHPAPGRGAQARGPNGTSWATVPRLPSWP